MAVNFIRYTVLAVFLGLSVAGCGGGGDNVSVPVAPPAAPATELALSATGTDSTIGGAPVVLTASLNGTGTVTWQLAAGNLGTLSASSGASVSYTPPATSGDNAVAKVTITATAGNLSKTVTLNLLPNPDRPGLFLLAGNVGSTIYNNVSLDGTGAAARFIGITGITGDAAGNIYVTENGGEAGRLRKITSNGSVITITSGSSGYVDGSLAQARFSWLQAPSVGPDGSIYFSDLHRVTSRLNSYYTRKLSAGGTVSTLAVAGAESLSQRGDVLASPDGKVYRYTSTAINIINPDGSEQLFAGGSPIESGSTDGAGAAARFSSLHDLAVDKNGILFGLDLNGVRQITSAGVVTTAARIPPLSSQSDGAATLVPSKIGLDGGGNVLLLYVSDDPAYYEIRKLGGGAIEPLYRVGTPHGPYDIRPQYMHVQQDGTILLARRSSIIRLNSEGKASLVAGTQDDTYLALDGDGDAARYVHPGLLAADKAGNVYSVENVVDQYTRTTVIRMTTPAGKVSTYANVDQSVSLSIRMNITGMLVTPAGQLMVSLTPSYIDNEGDKPGGGIYQVEAGNKFTLIAGAPGVNTAAPLQQDGAGTSARFGAPKLAGIDSSGNLYVHDRIGSDTLVTNVRKITPQAIVSTIAALPADLNLAPDGNNYQFDLGGSVIYRVTPTGVKTIVAGVNDASGIMLGALPGQLSQITSIVPTGPNSLAVASGSAILKLVLPK